MGNNTLNYSGADQHIKWGTTWSIINRFKDVDWSGEQFNFTVKKFPDADATDTEALIIKNNADMTISYNTDDPANPYTEVIVYTTRTDNQLEPAVYQYDLKYELSGGTEDIAISGCYEIRSVVTGR